MTCNFSALPGAPIAEKRATQTAYHGITLHDNYAWLRADNWQEAMREPEKLPEDIKGYLTAENAYYDKAMGDTEGLQETLIAEMRGRIKEDDSTVPRKHGPFAYSWRYTEGEEHPVMLRAPLDGGDEHILLDVNIEAKGEDYFHFAETELSPNHNILLWSADTNGSEFYSLRLRDLGTGKDMDYQISDVESVGWADDQTLFYTRVDENHRPTKVFRHTLGSDSVSDVLVYEEKDNRYGVSVSRSRSGKFIGIFAGMNDENEVWFIPTDTPKAAPRVIEPRQPGVQYTAEEQGDHFLILTNADGAVDFKVVTALIATPSRENWVDVIPHQAGRMIVSTAVHKDWMIWTERENALPRICYLGRGQALDTKQVIAFEEDAYALGFNPSPDYDTTEFRFVYSSPTTPSQLFDFHLDSHERTLRKTTEIPSGHDPDNYVTRRIMAPSYDGVEVPVTILHHKDTVLDGSAPCLLYGYGSYGMSMPASFSANRLSLVNRGFIYAVAHVRGGEEKGRGWYDDAKFGKKVNSFYDFVAAGETLITKEYTNNGQIVIEGGSAGGLLVGAVVNMRPDLLAGVIGDVPFVDVLTTILDDTLPLTPGEWSQWGNPIESLQAFNDIASYSPYDNVCAQDYPAMLVTAGVSDPRVTYWEPAKWVAKLRATKTDDNVLLMRTNMTSGHFGKSGRFAALEDAARSYAFALKVTGKEN